MIPLDESYMEWDEEKHLLLNAHFRSKIQDQLRINAFLNEAVANDKNIQLHDLVSRILP